MPKQSFERWFRNILSFESRDDRVQRRGMGRQWRPAAEFLERRDLLAVDPFVQSISLTTPEPSNSLTLDYLVAFSEPVTGVDLSDFTLNKGGSLQGTMSAVSKVDAAGSQYRVSIVGVSGAGAVSLTLNNDLSIRDLSGNGLVEAGAPVSFQSQTIPPTPVAMFSQPKDVVLGDLSGDGKAEIIAMTDIGANVFANQGDGTFGSPQANFTGVLPYSSVLADMNGDGKPDIVAVNSFHNFSIGNNVSVLLGNGDGSFQEARQYPVGGSPRSVAVGDVNGDGRPDVVVGNYATNTVSVLFGNPFGISDGTLQGQQTYQVGNRPMDVAIGDVNNDGKPDIVVANRNSNTFSLLLGYSLGSAAGLFEPQTTFATGSGPRSIALSDLDGDGKLDVVVGNINQPFFSGSINVFKGNGDGTFQPRDNIAAEQQSLAIAIGDLNGDNRPDIAVAIGSGAVGVLMGNGDATFQPILSFAAGTSPQSVAIGDVNGDGRSDLAVANRTSNSVSIFTNQPVISGPVESALTTIAPVAPTIVSIVRYSPADETIRFPANGTFTFKATFNQSVTGVSKNNFRVFLSNGATAKIPNLTVTGSGHEYLITVSGITAGNGAKIGVNLVNGTGIVSRTGQVPDSVLAPVTLSLAGPDVGRYGTVVADINGDGNPDVISRNGNTYNATTQTTTLRGISVLLGNADGTFRPQTRFDADINTFAVADINGDGKPDLVTSLGQAVNWHRGNGDGTFQGPQPLVSATSGYINAVAVADVSGDGKPDIVFTDTTYSYANGNSYYDGRLTVVIGNGNGTFQPRIESVISPYAYSITTADINGDGRADIITRNYDDDSASDIRLSNGDGTFQPTITTNLGASLSLLADLNGDDKADAVTIDDKDVRIHFGIGDGTFQSPQAYTIPVEHGPYGIRVADMNGDGEPDLVVMGKNRYQIALPPTGYTYNFFPNKAIVLLNQGNASFVRETVYEAHYTDFSSGGFFLADLNHDGTLDFILDSSSMNSLGVRLSSPLTLTGQQYTVQAATTTTVSAAHGVITYGDSQTFTVTVTSGSTPVTSGTVSLKIGETTFVSNVPLNSSGQAIIQGSWKALSVPTSGAGGLIVQAVYSGDIAHPSSSGATKAIRVNPRPLTVTPVPVSKIYDGNLSSTQLPVISAGSLAFDDTADFVQSYALPEAGPNNNLVTNGFVDDGANGANYRVNLEGYFGVISGGGNFIQPKPLLIVPVPTSKSYDGSNASSAVPVVLGLVGNDQFLALSQRFVNAAVGESKQVIVNSSFQFRTIQDGGFRVISNSQSVKNYTIVFQEDTVGIGAIIGRQIVVTPNNATFVYGSAVPTLTATYSGFLPGESIANLPSLPTLSTSATPLSGAGTYSINLSGGDAGAYSFSFRSGTMTVTPAPLLITADAKSKEYGDPVPNLTASYSGFVGGQSAANLTSEPYLWTSAEDDSFPGAYAITPSGASSPNYTITYASSTLNVTPALVVVTADNASMGQGSSLPSLTVSYDGFAPGENDEDLTSLPTVSTTATSASPAGNYPIVVSGAAGANYVFRYVAGNLRINTATRLSLTVAAASSVAGAPLLVTVTALDQNNNRVTTFNGGVTLSATGTGAANPNTFLNLVEGRGTVPITFFQAGAQSLTVVDFDRFSQPGQIAVHVVPAAPARLSFLQQPTPVSADAAFSLPVRVEVLDAYDNRATNANLTVVLGISSPGAFKAGSATAVAVSGGIATFSNLAIATSGSFALTASAAGLPSRGSDSFDAGPQSDDRVVGGLMFRSFGAGFSSVGNILSNLSEVFVGFSPSPGQPFIPLLSLAGGVTINTSALTMACNGAVSSVISGIKTALLDALPSTNLSSITDFGFATALGKVIRAAGVDFTLGSFKMQLDGAAGPELQLQGTLSLLGGLSVAVSGNDFVRINKNGVTLTGVAASITGSGTVAGVSFAAQSLGVNYNLAANTFTIAGAATATVGGIANLGVALGGDGTGGLVITAGAVTRLDMAVTTTFSVAGVSISSASPGLKFAYNASNQQFGMTGAARVTAANVATFDVTFGYGQSPGLVINSGNLASLDLTVNTTLTISSVAINASNVRLTYSSGEFSIASGSATVALGGASPLAVNFGYNSSRGLVIANGSLTSLAMTVSSTFTVGGVRFRAAGLGLLYSSNTYSMVGSASVAIGGIAEFGVAFGQGSTPGLVVSGGSLTSLALTINSSFSVSGVTFNASNLQLNYDLHQGQPRFSIAGSTSLAVRGVAAFDVTFGFGSAPGMVISNGSLTNLDLTVTSLTVAAVNFNGSNIRLVYALGSFSLSGTVGVTIAGNSFSATFGTLGVPGMVIENGSLRSLYLSVSGTFTVGAVSIRSSSSGLNPSKFTYVAGANTSGTYTLSGEYDVEIANIGNNFHVAFGSSANPGIVIRDGAVQNFNMTLQNFNFGVAGVGFSGSSFQVGYDRAASRTTISGADLAVAVPGFNLPFTARFGFGNSPGLVIANGVVTDVAVSMTGGFQFKGVGFTANNLGLAYTQSANRFVISGSASLSIGNRFNIGATFGDSVSPGLVIENGVVTSFNAAVTTGFTVSGLSFQVNNLRFSYASSNASQGDDGFRLVGGARVQYRTTFLQVDFINQGLVLSNGSLVSLDMKVNSSFTVFDVTIGTNDLRFQYDAPTSTFAIASGVVTVSTKSGGQFGSMDSMAATFGNSQGRGLVIANGTLTELHIAVHGSFTIGALTISAESLTIDYTNTTGILSISGGAAMQIGPLTVGVAFPKSVDGLAGLTINTNTGEIVVNSFIVQIEVDLARGFAFRGSFQFERYRGSLIYSAWGEVNIPKVGTVGGSFTLVRNSSGSLYLDRIAVHYHKGSTFGIPIPKTGVRPVELYITQMSGAVTNIGAGAAGVIVSASISFNYGPSVNISGTEYSVFKATGTFTVSADYLRGNYTWSMLDGKLGTGNGSFDFNFANEEFRARISSTMPLYVFTVTLEAGFRINTNALSLIAVATLKVADAGLPFPFDFIQGKTLGSAGFYLTYVYGSNSQSLAAAWVDISALAAPLNAIANFFGADNPIPTFVGASVGFDGSVTFPVTDSNVAGYRANVFDGPLSGALIFADSNGNGLFDPDERNAVTDANGDFDPLFAAGTNATLIAIGGFDISTGLLHSSALSAPDGSSKITPYTSVANELKKQLATMTDEEAKAFVASSFELPTGFNITTDNVVAEALVGDAAAARAFATQIQLANAATMIGALQRGENDIAESQRLAHNVYAAIAKRVLESDGAVVDLADPATLVAIIDDSALISGLTVDAAVAAGTAAIIADVNQRIGALPVAANLGYLQAVVAVQQIGQGAIADQLSRAVAGTIADTVAANTGAALDAQIAAAATGTLVAPIISAVGQSHLVGGDDTWTTYDFIVERDSTVSPLLPVSVDFATEDGTALAVDGDYVPVSGTLTWAPGEMGAKHVTVQVAGRSAAQTSKYFALSLSNPVNATLATAGTGGLIVYGQATTTTTTLERVSLRDGTTASTTTRAGEEVGLQATVVDDQGHAAFGAVGFYRGADLIGIAYTDPATGIATFATSNLPVGESVITATYLGVNDSSDAVLIGESTSAAVIQEVNKAEQTIAFGPIADQVYGVVAPDLAAVAESGLPVSFQIVSGPATIVDGQLSIAGAGTIIIEATQAGDDRYNAAAPIQQSFTVSAAQLTFTVDPKSILYGDAMPALTGSFTGFINGDTEAVLTALPTLSLADYTGAAGSYTISAADAVASSSYTIEYVSSQLTVNRAELTVIADDAMMVYGGSMPTLAFYYLDFVNGENEADLTTLPTVTTVDAGSGVGVYDVAVGGAVAENYEITFVSGNLTITPATVIVSADAISKVYGAAMPTLTASYSGFVNGDTDAVLTTTPFFTPDADESSHVGEYAIDVVGAEAANYVFQYEGNVLTITPASLTIIAGSFTATFGSDWSSLAVDYSGFVNDDSPESLLVLPSVNAPALGSSPGIYDITIDGAFSSDYLINYVAGQLEVTPATLTITPDDVSTTYGTTPTLTATIQGFVDGDDASIVSGLTLTVAPDPDDVGIYQIAASNAAATANYNIVYAVGTLFVDLASTTITITENGPSPSVFGQTVQFVVSVTGGVPDGESVFIEDADNPGVILATGILTGGIATIDVSSLSIGSHNLVATYPGNGNLQPSISNLATQDVLPTSDIRSITWDGGGDGATWSDAANWVADIAPDDNDIAIFADIAPGLVNITDAVVVGAIHFANTSGSFDIALAGGSIQVSAINVTGSSDNAISADVTISENGIVALTGSGTLTIDGMLAGSFSGFVTSGALLLLNTANALTSATTFATSGSGTLGAAAADSMSALGGAALSLGGGTLEFFAASGDPIVSLSNPITISSDSTLSVDSTLASIAFGAIVAIANAKLSIDGTRPVSFSGGTLGGDLELSHSNELTLGAFAGAGDLIQSGAGTMILIGANSYLGATAILSGTVAFGGGSLPTSTHAIIAANATLDLNGSNQEVASLAGAGNVVNGNTAVASTLTVSAGSGSTAFDGVIVGGADSGTINVMKSGLGTQILAGGNTYTGETTINAGVLVAANDGALGSTAAGTVVNLGGTLQIADGVHISGESLSITGPGAAGSNGALVGAGVSSFSGPITLIAVAGVAENVALGKPATQSSDGFGGFAPLAVDGNTSGDFGLGSVTHTDSGPSPWWEVDLGESFPVDAINVWNRSDCCSDRLGDYWVFVADTPFLDTDTAENLETQPGVFGFHATSYPDPSTTIPVNAVGRYVRVQLDPSNTESLSLAEVEVFTIPTIRTARIGTVDSDSAFVLNGSIAGGSVDSHLSFAGLGLLTVNADISTNISAVSHTEAGTTSLNGNNTYVGSTTISGGTVNTGANNAFGSTTTLTVSGANTVVNLFDSETAVTAVGTADFTAGTGVVNTGRGQLVIATELKLADLTTATLSEASTFSARGSNLVTDAMTGAGARTLILTGGTLTLNTEATAAPPTGLTSWVGTETSGDVSNSDLLHGLTPISTDTNFAAGEEDSGPVAALTDGFAATPSEVDQSVYAVGDNTVLTYELDTIAHPEGYDISSIAIFSTWRDSGRSQLGIDAIAYATVDDPTTFIVIAGTATTTGPNSDSQGYSVGANGHEVTYSAAEGVIASRVASIQFRFSSQQNGYVGYGEIDVLGAPTPAPATVNLPNTYVVASADANLSLQSASRPGYSHTLGGLSSAAGATLTVHDASVVNLTGLSAVNGTLTGAAIIVQDGGQLSGTGVVASPATIESGASLSSGESSGNEAGLLGIGELSLVSGSTFHVNLKGPTPGNGAGHYDRVHIFDSVNLNADSNAAGGATLTLTLADGFVPSVGAPFVIIENDSTDPITTQFNGLSEGDHIDVGSARFTITYQGDADNNDVVLTYAPLAPTVTSIVPVIGPTTGGTLVTILGTNFAGITAVRVDNVSLPPASFTVDSATQITVIVPAHAAGAVDIEVVNAGGTGSLAGTSDFTYATPTVASLEVNSSLQSVTLTSTGSVVSLAGQNSIVKHVVVTFNQAVTVASDAFTVTPRASSLVSVSGGAGPSTAAVATSVSVISPSQYLVTFSGPGTHDGGILRSGIYDLTTLASKVSAHGETMSANQSTTIFAMFGTVDANNTYGSPLGNGDSNAFVGDSNAFVDPGSLFQFSDSFGSNATITSGAPPYNIVFDANLDGFIDPGDLFAFSDSFGINWTF